MSSYMTSAEGARIDITLTKTGNVFLFLRFAKITIKTVVFAQAATLGIDSQKNHKVSVL